MIFRCKSVIYKTSTQPGLNGKIDTFKRSQFRYPLKFKKKTRRMTWKDRYLRKESNLIPKQRLQSNNIILKILLKASNYSNKESLYFNLSLSMKMNSNWRSNRWLKKSCNAVNLAENNTIRSWPKRWLKKRQSTMNSLGRR